MVDDVRGQRVLAEGPEEPEPEGSHVAEGDEKRIGRQGEARREEGERHADDLACSSASSWRGGCSEAEAGRTAEWPGATPATGRGAFAKGGITGLAATSPSRTATVPLSVS